jgi:AraC-like DNA-binding protein
MSDRSGELRFLHGGCRPRCDATVDKSFVGYRSIQFMESGVIALSYGQRRHRLEGRWAWPHHPGPRIRLHAVTPTWHHRYIAVSGPLCDAWAAEGLWPTLPQPVPESIDLGGLLDECLLLFQQLGRTSQRRAINRLEDALLQLQEARGGSAEAPWLARARTLLAHPDGFRAEVGAVAAACGMPPSTFRRRFAAAAGMSPLAWAMAQRMARARGLLVGSTLTMEEISAQLGYDDPAFFGKQFRRQTGRPPAAWRREFA